MTSFTTFYITLLVLFAVVYSSPLQIRDVFVPPVLYPHSGTVWKVGESQTVTWNVSNAPAQITNTLGSVVLAKAGIENWQHPLASGFNILDGHVKITVPQVVYGTDYAIVVFGDSGNYGEQFTIKKS
jgi:hypothetical protein